VNETFYPRDFQRFSRDTNHSQVCGRCNITVVVPGHWHIPVLFRISLDESKLYYCIHDDMILIRGSFCGHLSPAPSLRTLSSLRLSAISFTKIRCSFKNMISQRRKVQVANARTHAHAWQARARVRARTHTHTHCCTPLDYSSSVGMLQRCLPVLAQGTIPDPLFTPAPHTLMLFKLMCSLPLNSCPHAPQARSQIAFYSAYTPVRRLFLDIERASCNSCQTGVSSKSDDVAEKKRRCI
jgi:hypothetical protein